MARGWFALWCVAGCSFDGSPSNGTAIDAAPDGSVVVGDDAIDAAPDAVPDASTACRSWSTAFDSDPTQQNLNGDAAPDFAVRNGLPFAGTLDDGEWKVPAGSGALDTNPKDDFAGVTASRVRLRCTQQATATCATMFINAGYGDNNGTIAGLYIDVRLEGANQGVHLFQRTAGTPQQLTRIVANTTDFLTIDLVVDLPQHLATMTLDGQTSTHGFSEFASVDDDRWTSLWAAGNAEYDSFSVTTCPP